MELLQLRYFQTVARMQSITKAANYYHIPQPAMSQTIARLEKECGSVRLFDRRNNRLILNDQGKLFLQYVDRALMELDNGIAALTSERESISGSIRMLVLENRRFVLHCVSAFSSVYPDVNFAISHDFYSEPSQTYDICISSRPAYLQMRASRPLIREPIILAVYEGHPLAERSQVELAELKEEKLITMSSRSSLYSVTCENCRACGFEPHIPFICDDPYFVRKYISEKMGIALAPAISWQGRFRENTRLIPVINPSMYVTSYLIWDENRSLSAAIRKFRDYMLEEAAKLDGNLIKET